MSLVLSSNFSYKKSTVVIFLITIVFCLYGLSLPLGPVNVRLEKIMALFLFLSFICNQILHGEFIKIKQSNLLLALWALLAFGVSLFSVNPGPMLKHWFDLSISISFYYLVFHYRPTSLILSRPNHIVWIGFFLGLFGALIAMLYWGGVGIGGTLLSNFAYVQSGAIRIKLTLVESNIYGAVMAAFCLLSIAERRKKNLVDWMILFFCHAGLILSYSRGPLVAYFFSLVLYYKLIEKKNVGRLLALVFIAIVVFSTYQLIQMGLGYEQEGRFMRYNTLTTRFVALDLAFQTIAKHPLLGSGIYSAESLYAGLGSLVGADDDAKGWIGILPVAILHDTGIVGFLLFYGFFYIVFRNGYRTMNYLKAQGFPATTIKRSAVWIVIGVMMHVISLATSVYSMGLFWGVMAIVAIIPVVFRSHRYSL